MPVNVTVTRATTLFNDADGSGHLTPGDTLRTVILVTNSGNEAALDLTVTDELEGVTLVPGSVQITPIANDDAFNMVGNTPIILTRNQLIGDDVDPDGDSSALIVSITPASGTNGTIVDNGDGTYTFTPTTGFNGAASFTYSVTDEDGLTSVETGTVTLNVSGFVWYVDADYGGANGASDGSYLRPFTSFQPLNDDGTASGPGGADATRGDDDVDGANSTIFVYSSGTAVTGGITLEAGQKLYGDGHEFQVNGLNIGETGVTANTTINHSNYGVTLSTDNEIQGVTFNGTATTAVGIQDGNGTVGNLVIDKASVTGNGKAVDIDQGGTINIDLDVLSSSGSATEGVHLQGVSGTFNAASGSISFSTGVGFLVGASGGATANSGGNATISYGGQIVNPTGSAVEIQDRTGGTVTFSGAISDNSIGSGVTGIRIADNGGTVNFTGQTTLDAASGSTGAGISILNGSSGVVNFNAGGSGLDITTGSGMAFTWGGGTVNIEGSGNTITTTTGTMFNANVGTIGTGGINFASMTGGNVSNTAISLNNIDTGTFNGGNFSVTSAGTDALNVMGGSSANTNFGNFTVSNASGGGIEINASSGNHNFTGTVTLNTGGGDAIALINNTGGSTTFSGGNLNVDTTAGHGILADHSSTAGLHTLNITGANNSIVTTSGGAIYVENVTSNITLNNVSSAGATGETGVYLRNTGSSGQFVVTGSGSTAGSGGTFNGNATGTDGNFTQGVGIYLENVSNVSLSNLNFTGTYNNFGIRGEQVNNFTLRDSALTGTFGTSGAHDEGAIRFGTDGGSTSGLTGTALFEGNNIANGREDNLRVYVASNNTLNMTVRDSANDAATFGTNSFQEGNSAISIRSAGTSNVTVLVDGVQFTASRSMTVNISAIDNSTMNATVRNSQFSNSMSALTDVNAGTGVVSGQAHVAMTGGGTGNYTFNYAIDNNTMVGSRSSPVYVAMGGTNGNASGVITGNTIGTNDGVYAGGGGYIDGDRATMGAWDQGTAGIFIISEKFAGTGNVNHAVRIQNNTIQDIRDATGSIWLKSGQQDSLGTMRLEATIIGNTLDEAAEFQAAGIYAQVAGTGSTSADAARMGLHIQGNTINMGSSFAYGIQLDHGSTPSRFYMPGYGGATGGTTASTDLGNFWTTTRGNTINVNTGASLTPAEASSTHDLSGTAFVLATPLGVENSGNEGWEIDDPLPATTTTTKPKDDTAGSMTPSTPDDDSDTGTGTGGDTPAGPAHPVIVDDNVLSQAEIDYLKEAAIERWIAAGATEEQVAAMRATNITAVDMAGLYIATSDAGGINVDTDGAGFGWFLDTTPGEDGEYTGSGTQLTAVDGSAADGRMDLLTVIMHELGHQIGLHDSYTPGESDELMYGYVNVGERRLPEEGDADGAVPGTVHDTAYALTPVNIGTLEASKAFQLIFLSTLDPLDPGLIQTITNTSTVTGSNFTDVTGNEDITAAGLTLGNLVWHDVNKDGDYDSGTDTGIDGVTVTLYVDDGDTAGVYDANDTLVTSVDTAGGGFYSFTGLAEGDYVVVIGAANFATGEALVGLATVPGAADPDANTSDVDDNGALVGSDIASAAVTLAYGTEPAGDVNNTVDFGFITPNQPPAIANLDGNNVDYTEGAGFTAVDLGSNVEITDADGDGEFDGGSLTITVTGLVAGDEIRFNSNVAVDPDTSEVSVGGTVIGILTILPTGWQIDLDADATHDRVETVMRAVEYRNTTEDPSGTRTFSWTVVDGDGTDSGAGDDSTTVTSTVTILSVNDAPTGAANTVETSEDDAYYFQASDFGFSDTDGDALDRVAITELPTNGKLYIDLGSGPVLVQTFGPGSPAYITKELIDDGKFWYEPDADEFGAPHDSFKFKVEDDGGTDNGGANLSPEYVMTIDVTADNFAPTFALSSTGPSATLAYKEDDGASVIAPDAELSDSDSVNFDTGTLTVKFDANGEATDQLGILHTGTGAGEIGVSGSDITYNGVVIGTFTGGTNGTDLVVTFDADATPEAAQALVQAITYHSTAVQPSLLSRTVNFTVTDGDGGSAQANAAVNLTGTNDAPTVDAAASYSATEQVALDIKGTIAIDDVDSGSDPVTVILSVDHGVLHVDAGTSGAAVGGSGTDTVVIVGSLAEIRDLLDTNATSVLTFTSTGDAPPATATLSVTINDLGNGPVATTGPELIVNGSFETQDNVNDTSEWIQAAPNDYNGVHYRMASTLYGWQRDDANEDFELNTPNGNAGFVPAHGDAAIDLESDLGENFTLFQDISGVPGGTLLQLTFSASQPTGGPIDANPEGSIEVYWNGALVGTATPASTAMEQFTFTVVAAATGTGTGGANRIEFREVGAADDARGTILDAVSMQAVDTGSATDTATINIAGVNDNPTFALSSTGPSATLAYTENDGASAIAPTAVLSDIDSANFDTGTLTVKFDANGEATDQLGILHTGTGAGEIGVDLVNSEVSYGGTVIGTFTGGANGTDLVITFDADATPAAVDALVQAISYHSTSENPGTGARTVNFTVTDGDGGSAQANAAVNITLANDAPELTLADTTVSGTEDSDVVFSAANLNGISVYDVDGDNVTVTLMVDFGTLTLSQITGLTVIGNSSSSVEFSGSQADVNAALEGLVYRGSLNREGDDTLSIEIHDGVLTDTGTITITLADDGKIDGTGGDDDPLYGTAQPDVIFGYGGNDTIYGLGSNDWIDGGTGTDTMHGGLGNDEYLVDDAGDVIVENENEGTDTVQASVSHTLSANVEHLFLTGTALSGTGNGLGNWMFGNALDNTLTGLGGNDVLDGGLGADVMTGGTGHDAYYVDDAGDDVVEAAFEGTDKVFTTLATYTLTANVENLQGTSGTNQTLTGNGLNNIITAGAGDDTLYGGDGNDRLVGGAGDDGMVGGDGDDVYDVDSMFDQTIELSGGGTDRVRSSVSHTLWDHVENLTLTGTANINGTGNALDNSLSGNSGNNYLDGGAGADVMHGNGGNDVYAVDNEGDVVIESVGEGYDVVMSSVSYRLANGYAIEQLTLTGTADINGTGNDFANTIYGNSGNNVLSGGGGDDLMAGGLGDDTYVVDSTGDSLSELAGEGTDTVVSSVSWTLADDFENLTLTGAAAINGTGNGVANVLIGNSAANVLDGGAGADTMSGGSGNDSYHVDEAGDQVIETAGGGLDTVVSTISYTLGDYLENLTLGGAAAIDGTGNVASNVLTGNAAANRLDGGIGSDTMIGGDGNDMYEVDNVHDVVVEAAGEGMDTVRSAVSYTLSANVERLFLTGSAAINATGNSGANTLLGNGGANVLNGMGGNDVMNGQGGNDTYYVDSIGDTVIEVAGGGTDTVMASTTYYLSSAYEIENLVLTGNAAIAGYGNHLANTLTGNGGNNRLDGGAGGDTMIGGLGNDTYVVDDAGDTVVEMSGEGTDTVRSSISYALGDHVERLFLTGTANIDGNGNAGNNVLVGNDGNNRLDGGAGVDVMNGGAGNDTYVVESAGESVIELAGGGFDTIESSVTYYMGEAYEIEMLVLIGTGDIKGYGNSGNNIMLGNSGSNGLGGGDGDDDLFGRGGNDRLAGGAGADNFYFDTVLGAGNVDQLLDFTAADDTIMLDVNIFNTMAIGTLGEGQFVAGTAAGDADDRIIYDSATGNIWYDADGSDAGAAILFATVVPGTTLTHLDFEVYTPMI